IQYDPRGTPLPGVQNREQAVRAASNEPANRKRNEEMGSIPAAPDQMGPEALARLVRSEVDRWATVVRAAGSQPQ
ncbi:MAG: tripartite tricarboxylate transporter substrate binding protein BugD, partial [bacterium]